MIPCGGELAQYLGKPRGGGSRLPPRRKATPDLLAEVVRPQQAEVIVRVAVVQRQNQIYQGLPAAQAPPAQATASFSKQAVIQGQNERQESGRSQATSAQAIACLSM